MELIQGLQVFSHPGPAAQSPVLQTDQQAPFKLLQPDLLGSVSDPS